MIKKEQLLIKEVEEEIIKKITKLEAKNNKVVKVVEEMKKAEVKVLRNDKYIRITEVGLSFIYIFFLIFILFLICFLSLNLVL